MEEIKVNDGGGLFDSDGLIDTLITDCNDLTKHIAGGQYIQYCNTIVAMIQKLSQLKNGIRNDRENRDRKIEEMKQCNDELVQQLIGLPAEGKT